MKLPCDCCTGVEVLTPSSTTNRAGLIALLYRVGTYATFFETMQARLSSAAYPALAKLKTREKDDTSIALLDAWSAVGDVLTFYQERIANEGYLRTATERRSILEQARLIGYRLRPGVAASVYLAYTIEKDSPPVTIPKTNTVVTGFETYKNVALVNVIGPIDIDTLVELSGHLNVPKIDIEKGTKKQDKPIN